MYAGRGARLFLAGRDPAKLRALVDARGDAVAGSREVDLTAPGAAGAAVSAALEALGGLDVAVIAHGWLGDQLASERDVAEAERIIDTNFLVGGRAAGAARQPLRGRGRGQHRVMSSVAGDRGRPRNYTYGAAKGALNVYLQGLRTRLWPRGVGVQTLKLGPGRHAHDRHAQEDAAVRARRPRRRRTSSPRSTRAAPRPTSPGTGAGSWRSSATCRSACCSGCRRCRAGDRAATDSAPAGQFKRMGSRRLLLTVCLAAAPLAVGLALATGHDVRRAEAARPLFARGDDYVGASACRACHPDHHASWRRTYHASMTQLPDARDGARALRRHAR